MYDIKPLEEEWKKYKKKKRRPWFVLIFSIFLILLISLTFLNYKEIDFIKFYDKSKVEIVTDKSTTLLIDKALTTLEVKKPKASEVRHITETEPMTVTSNENGSIEIVEDLPIAEDLGMVKEPRVKIETTTIQEPRKKMHLDIIETTSVSAYKDVANRFYQSHETDDSLFLAKSYYRKGNYKKAEYWALETNKVNGNIEESWLIFAKSKVKLGRKNEAINILKTYIKRSNSAEAKRLLYKIKKGTL
jgi:tetratricopeptide (TPR) repeat protein